MLLEEIEKIIKEEVGVLLYFSSDECNVCHALRPKIKELFNLEFPKIKQIFIDAKENMEISSHFQVLSMPTILVYMDAKEFIREGRSVSLHKMSQDLERPYEFMVG